MFARLSNSWNLAKASFAVLRADKELILFPLASAIATILVMIVFAVPMAVAGVFDKLANSNGPGIFGYAMAFLFYLVMYFVVIFANSALVGAALIRLRGGDPTLRDGIQIAMDHVEQILGYALISATVGVILRALRERGGLLGQIVAWLGDIAWNLATYLVVPVLVVENIGPVDAIKRSTALLKKTWGEQIIGNFSIGLVFGLLAIAAVVVIGLPILFLAIASGSVILIALGIGVVVLVVAGISLVGSALNGIYVAALYRYATENVVDDRYFTPELVQGAFRPK
jgi:hypothetical protein